MWYNTNHIEGSTLTEEQTRFIFETNTCFFEDKTITNVNDIIETINHFRLIDFMMAFKECLKNNIIPFIILDKDKLFYYRGLNQYQNNKEKGYLIDTCLNAQDQYEKMIKSYLQ